MEQVERIKDDSGRVATVLAEARQGDPFGHQLHTALALVYLVLLPIATAPKDFAFGLLAIWTIIRLFPHTYRTYGKTFFGFRVIWMLIAWAGWHAISLTWSSDLAQGFDELGAYRMLITPLLLWPILDRVPWLIGAALVGVFVQNVIQCMQWQNLFGMHAGGEHRIGGLIHPILSGAWFAAALMWHLGAALIARGWLRWVSLALLGSSAVGVIATGSRGPWVALAVTIPFALIYTFVRRKSTRKMVLVIVSLGMIGFFVSPVVLKDQITPRIHDAIDEYENARENRVYWTSVGLRLGMAKWSWEIFKESPVIGTGPGDFAEALLANDDFQKVIEGKPKKKDYLVRDHPHSTYYYAFVCQGTIGGIFLLLVLMCAVRNCWINRPDHPYADGCLFALITWIIGAQFDCYNLNGNMVGMLGFIITVTLPFRPTPRTSLRARD